MQRAHPSHGTTGARKDLPFRKHPGHANYNYAYYLAGLPGVPTQLGEDLQAKAFASSALGPKSSRLRTWEALSRRAGHAAE